MPSIASPQPFRHPPTVVFPQRHDYPRGQLQDPPGPSRLGISLRPHQVTQVSLVSGDATAHEDAVLSVDVDDVDAAFAQAQTTGLLPDYDKCQAYIADVHSAFRSGS